jgi:hypothetical protein
MVTPSRLVPLALPKISKLEFRDFDLYTRQPNKRLTIDRKVFCLIGANGLGKSTFLNTLLYGLTGGLPARSRGFSSAREYFSESMRRDRREDYYDGRISEDARDRAAIGLELRWPNLTLRLMRPLFGPGTLSELSVSHGRDDKSTQTGIGGQDPEDAYRSTIVDSCGLKDFEQFVFLNHFVFAFDEDRHLLLWDSNALTHALYLSFGSDLDQANQANTLRREVEKQASRARNAAFAARKARDAADELENALTKGKPNDEDRDLQSEFDCLTRRLTETNERVHYKEVELRQADADVSDHSAALTELQIEYDAIFASRLTGTTASRHHPLIRATLVADQCSVCGQRGVGSVVQEALDSGRCPLCDSVTTAADGGEEAVNKLRNLDKRIESVRTTLRNALKLRQRLRDEYEAAVQSEAAAREAREVFLADHPNAKLLREDSGTQSVNDEIKRQRDEADRFKSQSRRNYLARDRARDELLRLERHLKTQYEAHSGRFVELFRQYAEEFIGLPVDIELEHRSGANIVGFELILTLAGSTRVQAADVSESQRFFLDIALRMAIAEFMSGKSASLLIDTPEGSLDISYEARAGTMLSAFAENAGIIIMTANLRSSELVIRLAETRRTAGMQIERMTEWTDLSEVQRQEEDLFTRAYSEIENALSP